MGAYWLYHYTVGSDSTTFLFFFQAQIIVPVLSDMGYQGYFHPHVSVKAAPNDFKEKYLAEAFSQFFKNRGVTEI
jgi:hypothetical protein